MCRRSSLLPGLGGGGGGRGAKSSDHEKACPSISYSRLSTAEYSLASLDPDPVDIIFNILMKDVWFGRMVLFV